MSSEISETDRRAPLVALLRDYRARWPAEWEAADRFLAFVTGHRDCFERDLEIGHVTGSAWLVDSSGERVLLTHHKKLDIWVQLGGHADGNPDIAAVALAEATEESGIEGLSFVDQRLFDIDIHRIPARPGEPEHFHFDARFALRAPPGARFTVSAESHALKWVEIGSLAAFTEEASMLRMATKWRGGA